MYFPLFVNPKDYIAVWRAIQVHLEYIHSCNEEINIIVHQAYCDDLKYYWTNTFQPSQIITYKTKLQFALIIRRLKNEKFFCITHMEVLAIHLLSIFKRKESYYWVQGIVPEEDFLRAKSLFRKLLLLIAEAIALKIATKHILVSNYMKLYIEKNRKLKIKNYIVIPCASDLPHIKTNKIKNSFVYIGGLSEWQRIDRILNMFCQIASINTDSKLYLITFDMNKMQLLVNKYVAEYLQNNIIISRIDDRNEIAAFLSTMEYGFLIRDNDPINNVSSPIKLAEYLSCGVNLILSDSVYSYVDSINNNECGIIIHNDQDISKLITFIPSEEKAHMLYNQIFNKDTLIERYKKMLG